MGKDYTAQLELLRELYKRVQAKEDVPEEEFKKAGVKNKARLKDIEKEISSTKKKASFEIKKDTAEEEEKQLEADAAAQGMTLEQFKEHLEEKKRNTGFDGDHAARHRAQQLQLAGARDKKQLERGVDTGEIELV